MTPLEILQAHQIVWQSTGDYGEIAWVECECSTNDYDPWNGDGEPDHRAHVAEVLDEAMREREAKMLQLIRDMADPGACWFDHHGGCQEHGYLDLKPGELCPHAEAKQLLGDEPNGSK